MVHFFHNGKGRACLVLIIFMVQELSHQSCPDYPNRVSNYVTDATGCYCGQHTGFSLIVSSLACFLLGVFIDGEENWIKQGNCDYIRSVA